jgi:hypothetical protein
VGTAQKLRVTVPTLPKQCQPLSTVQALLHPSALTVLASSHASPDSTTPFPHTLLACVCKTKKELIASHLRRSILGRIDLDDVVERNRRVIKQILVRENKKWESGKEGWERGKE